MYTALLALIPAALFAAVNHIDKHLLERFFKGRAIGSLLIFSSLIGIPVALGIAIFNPEVFSVPDHYAWLNILSGMIYICSLIPYMHSLDTDEASIVSPLFLMTPVISFILGFLFLRETLTLLQFMGAMIIVLGSIILSLDITEGQKLRIKRKILGYMFLASVLTAINGFLFKLIAVNTGFLTTVFWEYIGFICIAVIFLAFVRSYRDSFISVLKQNKLSVIGLNGINEIVAVSAKVSFHFASLTAPLALVFCISESFQPLFVFLFGILITMFFPSLGQERITKRHLVHKFVSISILGIGLYLISFAS